LSALATTTSTQDSGLLDVLILDFRYRNAAVKNASYIEFFRRRSGICIPPDVQVEVVLFYILKLYYF
jgi:hypothetical protein